MDLWQARRDRLRGYIASAGLTGAVVSRPEHVRYLTAISQAHPTYLLVTPSRSILIAATDAPAAEGQAGPDDLEVAQYAPYSPGALPDPQATADDLLVRLAGPDLVRAAIELDHLPVALARRLRISDANDLGPELRGWRRAKEPFEIAAIRSTVAAIESCITKLIEELRPGVSEATLAGIAFAELLGRSAESVRFDYTIAAGPRSAEPAPIAGTSRAREGDMVIVDLYPVLDGYAADLTRTLVVGTPSRLLEDRHQLVEEALRTTEQHLRPGVPVAEVDHILRQALPETDELRASMTHHSGHGIGLSQWEEPWIGPGAEGTLLEGDVIAIEPGAYVPGWGGIRIESDYVIRSSGCERLDAMPTSIREQVIRATH